jgi:hypothetical protein
LALILWTAGAAYAHELCTPVSCLDLRQGEPGTEVTVDFSTWKIVWNEELRFAPVGYAHRAEVGPIVLYESPDRELGSGLTFRVPDVPPGTYTVVFYDADEDFQHYFWDRFTVVRAPSQQGLLPMAVLIGVVLLVVAALVLWRVRRSQVTRD